jgi:hypothetical protein
VLSIRAFGVKLSTLAQTRDEDERFDPFQVASHAIDRRPDLLAKLFQLCQGEGFGVRAVVEDVSHRSVRARSGSAIREGAGAAIAELTRVRHYDFANE